MATEKYYETIEFFIKGTSLEKLLINEKQQEELKRLIKANIKITNFERRKTIRNFIDNNVNDLWLERIIEIRNLSKKGNSLKHFQLKFGDELGELKYKEVCSAPCRTIYDYINKFGEEEGKLKYNKSIENKKGNSTFEKFERIYGTEEGTKRWFEYQEKRKLAYKKRHEENYQFKNGRSLFHYIERHGKDEGTKLWEERNENQSKRFSIEYYINKYGETEGLNKWQEYLYTMDKTSLKKYKEKYGVEEGKKKYDERLKNLSIKAINNNKEYYINKYGEENGIFKYNNNIKNKAIGLSKINYSKISQKLFWWIYDELTEEQKNITKFGELNDEFIIYNNDSFYLIDMICGKAIIEFNGNNYHKENEIDIRIKEIEKIGFNILIIFEKEFNKEKIKTLNNCIEFINKNWL